MIPQEMISTICGKTEDGASKTMTGCYLYKYNPESEEVREINSCITYIPVIDIFPNSDLVQVDISYSSEADTDLYKMCQMIDKCRELNREDNENSYSLVFNFMPIDLGETDAVSIECIDPMINCLTALAPKSPVATLRLLFDAEKASFYVSDDINTSVLDTDIEYDISNRQRVNDEYRRKKEQNQLAVDRLEELKKQAANGRFK